MASVPPSVITFPLIVWSVSKLRSVKGGYMKIRRAAAKALHFIRRCPMLLATWWRNGHGGANAPISAFIRWLERIHECPVLINSVFLLPLTFEFNPSGVLCSFEQNQIIFLDRSSVKFSSLKDRYLFSIKSVRGLLFEHYVFQYVFIYEMNKNDWSTGIQVCTSRCRSHGDEGRQTACHLSIPSLFDQSASIRVHNPLEDCQKILNGYQIWRSWRRHHEPFNFHPHRSQERFSQPGGVWGASSSVHITFKGL